MRYQPLFRSSDYSYNFTQFAHNKRITSRPNSGEGRNQSLKSIGRLMRRQTMKLSQITVAAFIGVISAEILAAAPDPNVPNPPLNTMEANIDENGWIAVHEQGEADVKIVNEEAIDVNVIGGTVDAAITGGEVEVTNEVTMKLADGEVVSVEIIANSSTFADSQGFYMNYNDNWFEVMGLPSSPIELTHVSCSATSTAVGATESLSVLLDQAYSYTAGMDRADFAKIAPVGVCGSFFGEHANFEPIPTFTSYCTMNLNTRIPADRKYLILGAVGEPLAPIERVNCEVHFEIIP